MCLEVGDSVAWALRGLGIIRALFGPTDESASGGPRPPTEVGKVEGAWGLHAWAVRPAWLNQGVHTGRRLGPAGGENSSLNAPSGVRPLIFREGRRQGLSH